MNRRFFFTAATGDRVNTGCIPRETGAVVEEKIHSKPCKSLCESAQAVFSIWFIFPACLPKGQTVHRCRSVVWAYSRRSPSSLSLRGSNASVAICCKIDCWQLRRDIASQCDIFATQKRYNLRFARLRYICLTANAEAIKIPPTPAGISSSKFKTQFYISRKAENTACVLTSPLPTKAVRLCGDPKSGISHAVGVYRKFRQEFISLQPSAA